MAETSMNVPGTTAGSSVAAEAKESVRSAVDKLRSGREQAFEEAKSKVREAAEAQRQRAAEAVGGMAGALHRAADDLKSENESMGRYTNMAAERLDEVASYLRDTDWNSVIDGAEDFARRQPYWFIGGAMAAGFLVARTIKNAGETRRQGSVARMSRRMASSSTVGYGTSTEAGIAPATSATTSPISSTPSSASVTPGREV